MGLSLVKKRIHMYRHYFTIVSLSLSSPPPLPEETWLIHTYPGFQGYLSLNWMVSRKKLQLTSLIASLFNL